MPLSDLLTYTDVEELTGEESDNNSIERRRLEVFCARAQSVIRSRVVGVDARITAGSLDGVLVKGVAVDMVIAALEELEVGFRTAGEVYPENETRYEAANKARSLVRITAEQITDLAPPTTSGGGVFSVHMGGG